MFDIHCVSGDAFKDGFVGRDTPKTVACKTSKLIVAQGHPALVFVDEPPR